MVHSIRYRTNISPFARKSGPAEPHSLIISPNSSSFEIYRTNRSLFDRRSGPAGPHSLIISSNSLKFGRFVRCRALVAGSPLAVVRLNDAQTIAGVVKFAAEHGLKVQAKSGGHSYA